MSFGEVVELTITKSFLPLSISFLLKYKTRVKKEQVRNMIFKVLRFQRMKEMHLKQMKIYSIG